VRKVVHEKMAAEEAYELYLDLKGA
jgi:hypothetical protein